MKGISLSARRIIVSSSALCKALHKAEDLSVASRMERRLNFVTRPSAGVNAKGGNGHQSGSAHHGKSLLTGDLRGFGFPSTDSCKRLTRMHFFGFSPSSDAIATTLSP